MNALLDAGQERGLHERGRPALRRALQRALDRLRARCRSGEEVALDDSFWEAVEAELAIVPALEVGPALNATGVVLHTGLGRAPWPPEAAAAAVAAAGAAVVEIEREDGTRGKRERPVGALIADLSGAQAGLVVNNNAGAVLLAVAALAAGRGVVVSRSELVEIGGSYRLPAVLEAAGARMVEVGTTNRVHLRDYEAALEDPTVALVLRMHRSNFAQEGFTAEPSPEELATLCHDRGVPFLWDLGSGILTGLSLDALAQEPTVRASLAAGADLVTFSGDKLLGGPQAGLIAGAAPLVEKLRRHPLTRCLRLDKTLLAAVEATLRLHDLGPDGAVARVPTLALLSGCAQDLRLRAEALASHITAPAAASGWEAAVVATEGRVGSGASPTHPLPGFALSLRRAPGDAVALAGRLRKGRPSVFGRLAEEALLLDLRALAPAEDAVLARCLLAALP